MNETTTPCAHCASPISSFEIYCPECGAPAPGPDDAPDDARDTLDGLPSIDAAAEGPVDAAPDGSEPDVTPEEAAPEPEEAAPEPEEAAPVPEGFWIDWSPEVVAAVEEAARLEGMTTEKLVNTLVLPAVKKIIVSKKGLLTLDQAADRLGITKSEVVKMIASGELKAKKVEGEWKVHEGSLTQRASVTTSGDDQIELDLRSLAETSGLEGVDFDTDTGGNVSVTACYINQAGVLVCPRAAWRKLGRQQVVSEARDAVRRYLKRRDRDLGRF